PEHFRWMIRHFEDNGLAPADHWLIEAAVAPLDGEVGFHVGNSAQWYGQAIAEGPVAVKRPGCWSRLARWIRRRPAEAHVLPVAAVSLGSILRQLARPVDLIDADVQGSEADVFAAACDLVDCQVKRVHIGTHTAEVEARLRDQFTRLGWEPVF